MEIRTSVDKDFMNELLDALNEKKATSVVRSALSLLKWVTNEKKKNRVILSSTADGGDVHKLVMPGIIE